MSNETKRAKKRTSRSREPVLTKPIDGAEHRDEPHSRAMFFLQVLTIICITFVAYIPAMKAGFIWDDDLFLTNNPLILAPDGLYRFWLTTEAPDYFPLTSSMLWLEWRLWGGNPMGFHIVNILLHIAAALLFWRILKRLSVPGAWLASLIFAVHPVAVESVAWITERKNTLPLVFYCASIITFLDFRTEGKRKLYVLSLIAFLLALLSKTSVAMLPLVLVGIIWWKENKISKRDWIDMAPYFAIAIILSLVTIWFQYNRAIREDVIRTDGLLSRTVISGRAIWFYLYKAVAPVRLSFVYPRWEANLASPLAYIPVISIIVLMVLFWLRRDSWGRPFLIAIGYFIITLLPVLGFLNIYFMRYSLVADHWQYTSLIAIVALVTGLGVRYFQSRSVNVRNLGIGLATIVVVVLSSLTYRQSMMYDNQEVLWRETIARNPNAWIAYENLGVGFAGMGRFQEAVEFYEQALSLNPENVNTMSNIAVPLSRLGRFDEANSYLQKALEIDPKEPNVHNNLGLSLVLQGKSEEAVPHYEKALELNPNHADAHSNLGNALARLGRYDEALACFEKALDIYPDHARANYNMGLTLIHSDRFNEAIGPITRSIELNPSNSEAYNNLGVTCERVGDVNAAMANYRAAVQIAPGQTDARKNLVRMLSLQEQFHEALQHCEYLVKTTPDPSVFEQYGDVLMQINRLEEALVNYELSLQLQPKQPMLRAKIAMLKATVDDPALRNLDQALTLAKQAQRQAPNNPRVLDTVSMIYAEMDRFAVAVETAERAATLADMKNQPELADQIRHKTTLYSQGEKFRFDLSQLAH